MGEGVSKHMIGKKVVSAFMAMLLALTSAAEFVHAAAEDQVKLAVTNDFVNVSVHKGTGRFSISTKEGSPLRDGDNNKALLFERHAPESSFTTFRINGKDYIYGNDYGFWNANGHFSFRPTNEGLTNQSVWKIEELEVTQTITLLSDHTNPNVGNVKVSYSVRNDTSGAVEVGARMLLDTMLGANDASPVTLSGSSQFVHKETIIEQVPAYWRAVDDQLAPKVMSYGLLSGWGNITPDRMIIAHWNGISDSKWDYEINPELEFTSSKNPYRKADSAVALYWNPTVLQAGEQRVYETYYGLGSFFTSLKKANYNLQLFSPDKLTLNAAKEGYNEEVFEIVAEIDNTIDNARRLSGVILELNLPNELKLAPGEKAVQSIASIEANEVKTMKWLVQAKPQYSYKASRYRVSVQASGEEENIQTSFVILPAISGEPPNVQVLDLLPNQLYIGDEKKTLSVKGLGFEALKGSSEWQVHVIRDRDGHEHTIPLQDVTVSGDQNMSIVIDDGAWTKDEPLEAGTYKLRIHSWEYGTFERTFEVTKDEKYKSRSYGILLVVGHEDEYELIAVESEQKLKEMRGQNNILLELRGSIRELSNGSRTVYELDPGTTINSVLRFDTNEDMKQLYGEASQKIIIQKHPRDIGHSGDFIELSGNGILSIPSFPFVFGEFSVELEDGETYSLEADEEAGESPIEVEWSVLRGLSVIQQMDFFPVTIKNAVIGNQSVSFGGSLSLDFGMLSEDDKPSGGQTGGSGGGSGGSGSTGGGSGGSGNQDEEEEEEDDDDAMVRVSVDEARFGVRQKKDPFGAAGSYGFLGLRAEGEAGLPKDLVPGMDFGASGRVAIDTIDRKYEIEADVEFQVIELHGFFTLRFTENHIPVPDNFVFSVGGEPGIPLVPPYVVAYITKGGGGFKNLYDTVMGNFHVLPPLKLVMIGGIDISKVVKGDNLTLEMSMRGFEFSGELEIAKFKILKEVYGHILVADSREKLGVSIKAGARLEIFDVITGEVYAAFAFDSSKSGLFGPVSLTGGGNVDVQIPKVIPIVGGLKLAGAEAEFGTERIYGKLHILKIPVSFQYVWGDSMPKIASSRPEDIFVMDYGIGTKTYYDEETGDPAGKVIIGSNIHKVGDSRSRYASLADIPARVASSESGLEHTLIVSNQDYAVMELEFEGETPHIQVYDPDGSAYLLEDGVNYRVQEIPAEESQSGRLEKRVYVTVEHPKNGSWNIVSDKPVSSALFHVEDLPELSGVSVTSKGERKIQVNWTAEHTTNERIALYISEDNHQDPGHLLVDGLDVEAGSAEYTLPDGIPSGQYYIRAAVYKDGTTYSSAYSTEPVRVVNPYQPDSPSNITVAPAGNGLMNVGWTMNEPVDGYYIQLLDEAGVPIEGAGAVEVQGDQQEALIGGLFLNSQGQRIGLEPGHAYRVSVMAYRAVDGVKHFSSPSNSSAAHIPQPVPAELSLGIDLASGPVREAYDESGQLYYIVNRSSVPLKLTSSQPVNARLLMDGKYRGSFSGTEWTETIELQEGTNIIQVTAKNASGDISLGGLKIVSDTTPPELRIETPSPGAAVSSKDIAVKGVAEPGSRLTVNDKQVDVGHEGVFETEVEMTSYMSQTVTVTAEDSAGNVSVYETDVGNGSIGPVHSVRLKPVTAAFLASTSKDVSSVRHVAPLGGTQAFELVGIGADGQEIRVDSADVEWSLLAGEQYGSISNRGVLSGRYEGEVIVKASYRLTSEYALEDAIRVDIRETEDPGQGPAPNFDYDDWYIPPSEDSSDSGVPVASPEQRQLNADDAFEQMLRQLIEQENNVQFIKSAQILGDRDTVIPIDAVGELTLFRPLWEGKVGLGIGRVRNTASYENESLSIVGPMYQFKFDKPVRLKEPAVLKVKLDSSRSEELKDAAIYWLNERKQRWEYIGGAYDSEEQAIVARLPHFSKYALALDTGFTRFSDVSERWSKDMVYRLASIGVIDGSEIEGRELFQPEKSITRQEFVKLMVGAGGLYSSEAAISAEAYSDAEQVAPWAASYMLTAIKRQWISGTGDGERTMLEPQRPITRAEAAALIGRATEVLELRGQSNQADEAFIDEVELPEWSKAHIERLRGLGILSGYPDGSFRPDGTITREESASMIGKLLDVLYSEGKELR
jgi:trimeric autotransporter adhesin